MSSSTELPVNQTPPPVRSRAQRYLKTYIVSFGLLVAFSTGVFFGHFFFLNEPVTNAQESTTADGGENGVVPKSFNADQYASVWNQIKTRYVKADTKDNDLFYGSLQGLVASLNDPHSIFFPPKEAEQFNKDISGEFEGIGAEIGIKNNQLVVISPLSGSPAERAGLRAGDKILAIDKEITVGMDTFTAVTKIRGASGTPVVLSIGREKQLKPFDLKIVREKIVAPSFTYILKPNNIVYLRISQFNQDTIPLFDAALEKMPKNIKGVVVDLRNDPGRYLQVAVQVASKWIPNGDMVVEEKGRVGILGSFTSLGSQPFLGKKTVVIINKGSASASEILAGALQDYKLATIIGETSYGKGSVQDLKTFDDGSSLKLTIAEWFTPLGRNINKEGIKPDIEVKEDDAKAKTGQDAVLNKALQIITSGVEVKKVSEKK
jgi:carboxyl-terminal processing protease